MPGVGLSVRIVFFFFFFWVPGVGSSVRIVLFLFFLKQPRLKVSGRRFLALKLPRRWDADKPRLFEAYKRYAAYVQ
eukprot:111756-Prymnesium_polylepis.1